MATVGTYFTHGSAVAGADLSSSRYLLGHIDTDGDIVLAGNGEGDGVIMNAPASGEVVELAVLGIVKVTAATAITPGVQISGDAAGKAVVAATGDKKVGIALEAAAADGDIIKVLLGGVGDTVV